MNGLPGCGTAQRPALQRAAIHTRLGIGLLAGIAPLVGAETAPASPSVFTLNDGETVERVVLESGRALQDLAVLAFPEWRARGSTGGPLGVAAADGVGVVQLPGIPVSRGRVLVAAFRGGVPVGMSALDADAGDEVSLHLHSGAVTAELPAQDGSPPVDTVRIERLRDGTELADFSLGPFTRSLDFRLRPAGPLLSRDDLPAYAWYSVTGAEDNPSFYLDAGEKKSLGDLTAPNVAVTTGQAAVEIEMYEAARLQGVVRTPKGEPVDGMVTWRYAGTRSAESVQTRGQFTSTNAAGAFGFAALPPGRTEITVSVPGAVPEVVEYDLVPGSNEVEIRFESPLVRIEGVVVGPPDAIADVDRVIAVPDPAYTRPPTWLRAELAADGTFFFENMSPGTVELAATTRTHASRPVELVIAPTDTVRHVRLELLKASGRITGRIESTASLAGAHVVAIAGTYYSTSADLSASGEFELSYLAVGTWSLSLHHAGLSQGQVFYSDLATVEIPREGSFRYVVVDLTALPVLTLSGGPPGETVHASGDGNVKLDHNGNGILRLPRAGAHELFWKVEDHYFYQDVTVEGETHLDLTEPPARREPVPLFDY